MNQQPKTYTVYPHKNPPTEMKIRYAAAAIIIIFIIGAGLNTILKSPILTWVWFIMWIVVGMAALWVYVRKKGWFK
jgi:hypothetical protein